MLADIFTKPFYKVPYSNIYADSIPGIVYCFQQYCIPVRSCDRFTEILLKD